MNMKLPNSILLHVTELCTVIIHIVLKIYNYYCVLKFSCYLSLTIIR